MHQQIADLAPDTSHSEAPSLPLWEAAMRQAMKAERESRIALAAAGYERALSVALRLIEAPPAARTDDCLAALVVSHHNLADLRVAQGDLDSAAHLLGRAHAVLVALSLAVDRPAALRQAALRHSRETYVALIRHIARHGPHPHITRAIADADAALHPGGTTRH
ncbi:hypothetical protein [Caballeronia insecticola]|uniref:Uncharacterized protein n=1 Tax=Caballeronia insecticola TaxID=758793 RepID=R4WXA1_9BURK|nr:hypothetical protein [Caballeronia insecticola]BAN25750.1 putative uncharacterized protein [Caballeronia insecticola]